MNAESVMTRLQSMVQAAEEGEGDVVRDEDVVLLPVTEMVGVRDRDALGVTLTVEEKDCVWDGVGVRGGESSRVGGCRCVA